MPCDLRDKGVRPVSDGCGKHAAVLCLVLPSVGLVPFHSAAARND
jgi:hypothetical protein